MNKKPQDRQYRKNSPNNCDNQTEKGKTDNKEPGRNSKYEYDDCEKDEKKDQK